MRVIGGTYKGRRLVAPSGNEVRPTSDMVKEAIFNILQPYIVDAVVLDLFAGSGALGIEALSRGADFVLFNDKSSEAVRAIRQNLSFADSERYEVRQGDYLSTIMQYRFKKFDIVLIDPPYKTDKYMEIVQSLARGMLNDDAILVLEHDSKTDIFGINELPEGIILKSTRRYGAKSITVLGYGM